MDSKTSDKLLENDSTEIKTKSFNLSVKYVVKNIVRNKHLLDTQRFTIAEANINVNYVLKNTFGIGISESI